MFIASATEVLIYGMVMKVVYSGLFWGQNRLALTSQRQLVLLA